MGNIVDKIEPKVKIESLPEEQKDDLYLSLIMGKDYTEEVTTSRGVFILKYPKTADHVRIGKLAAHCRGYRPVEGFDMQTETLIQMASTLDVMVVSGPPQFEHAKKMNEKFSFMEEPSREFLAELYSKARMFRDEVELRLNPQKESEPKRVPAEKGDDAALDGGAFGNQSYGYQENQ
jgi:hypothetical protein